MKTSTIKITCSAADQLELDKLKEIQGALKQRSQQDIDRMTSSIIKYGFSFPFFVWKKGKAHYVLDGHGRLEALRQLQEQGYQIPPLPVAYVSAKDREEAKQKLLRMNSQYGSITREGLEDFTSDMTIDWDELSLPGGFNLEPGNEDEDDAHYTRNIQSPVYTPTGKKPPISQLVDTTKTDELIDKINAADLTTAERRFLTLAAYRHLKFDYGKIAEYYSQEEIEVQQLMEDSVLVIVDFHKAIEDGYVRLTEELRALYEQDAQHET